MKTEERTGLVFPLAGGSPLRTPLRAPRLRSDLGATPGLVMGNRAFMRAWAARRVARVTPATSRQSNDARRETGAA